jgi:transcriptional repressor NrdR
MKCPYCGHLENKVVDSRISQTGEITRRRRECLACHGRFTTYERVEEVMPAVVKKDGRREDFDREKILRGIRLAFRKRPVHPDELETIVKEVEQKVQHLGAKELPAQTIGHMVMSALRSRDKVAYIRFASVYREFKDAEEFLSELQRENLVGAQKESYAPPFSS